MSSSSVDSSVQPGCCDNFAHRAKVASFSAATTLVALGVIFGALLVVNHYYLNLGPINAFSQLCGNYFYLPLAVSGGLLVALVAGAVISKACSAKKAEKAAPVDDAPESSDEELRLQKDRTSVGDTKVALVSSIATLLAVAILFSSLIVVSHAGCGNYLGPFNGPVREISQLLGHNFYIPIVVSGGSMLMLIIITASCSAKREAQTKVRPPFDHRPSITLLRPEPEGDNT